jgi:hypothetical protein
MQAMMIGFLALGAVILLGVLKFVKEFWTSPQKDLIRQPPLLLRQERESGGNHDIRPEENP